MSERMEGRRGGFTLIELMVVIMIVGVLFAVALPMFENAGKKDTRQAAQSLLNTLRLARQHAISARQWTLVVFPNQDSGYSALAKSVNNLDRCLRSYAVLAVTNNMDGEYKFRANERDPSPDDMEFEFLTEWRSLPAGIYFDDEMEKQNYLFRQVGSQGYVNGFDFPWDPEKPNVKSSRKPMSAMLFKPNGRAYVMCDSSTSSGKYWQDVDGSRIYVSSAVFYPDATGESLGTAVEVPGGTNTVIVIQNKTGQVRLEPN